MPYPHPDWEVVQKVRQFILDYKTWLEGMTQPGNNTECKAIAFEAIMTLERCYNMIQNGEQFGIPAPGGGLQTEAIFPGDFECVTCPPPPPPPEEEPK